MTNDPDMCTKSAKGRESDVALNRLERRLKTQQKIWNELQYPSKMKSIHDQVVQVIQNSMQWVQLVKAGEIKRARKLEAQIQGMYATINGELTQKFNIEVPSYCQVKN